jgi:hypothetical protein
MGGYDRVLEDVMGFFDDLEAEVGDIPDSTEAHTEVGDVAAVIAKLRGGWSQTLRRNEPIGRDSAAQQFQEAELSFDGRQFVWTTRLVEQRGRTYRETLREDTRRLDEAGLVDALGEHPWVARAALQAAGVDLSRPDF